MSYVVARLTAREWCSNLTLYKKYICLYTRSIANSPAPMWKFPAGKRRVTTQLPHPPTHHSVPGLLLQEPPPVIHHLPPVPRCQLLLVGVLHVRPRVVAVLLPAVPERRHLHWVSMQKIALDRGPGWRLGCLQCQTYLSGAGAPVLGLVEAVGEPLVLGCAGQLCSCSRYTRITGKRIGVAYLRIRCG